MGAEGSSDENSGTITVAPRIDRLPGSIWRRECIAQWCRSILGFNEKRTECASLQPRDMDCVSCRPHCCRHYRRSDKARRRSGVGGLMKNSSTVAVDEASQRSRSITRWTEPQGKRKPGVVTRVSDYSDCAVGYRLRGLCAPAAAHGHPHRAQWRRSVAGQACEGRGHGSRYRRERISFSTRRS